MFASLKEKFLSSSWAPQDEHDRAIADLVDKATSEQLEGPDWGVNMAIVDLVNRNPAIMEEKLMRVLRRNVIRGSAKVQILTLTVLETCVKNGHASIYAALCASDLWSDLIKSAADTSVTRGPGQQTPA
eukprot:gene9674-8498_t